MSVKRERYANAGQNGATEVFVPPMIGGNGRIMKELEAEYIRTTRESYAKLIVPFHDPSKTAPRLAASK